MGFVRYAILPMLIVSVMLSSSFLLPSSYRVADSFAKFVVISLGAVVVESLLLWMIGMNKGERTYLMEMILKKLKR